MEKIIKLISDYGNSVNYVGEGKMNVFALSGVGDVDSEGMIFGKSFKAILLDLWLVFCA